MKVFRLLFFLSMEGTSVPKLSVSNRKQSVTQGFLGENVSVHITNYGSYV